MPPRRTFGGPPPGAQPGTGCCACCAAELAYYRAKEERKRESDRLAAQRYRARVSLTRQTDENVRPTRQTYAPPAPPASPSPDPTLSTPPTVPPKERGNVRVAALIDALRAEGMTDELDRSDRQALLASRADPGEVAALYAAVYRGEYGDQWMHDNLTVALCLKRLPGWRSYRAGYRAPQGDPWARSNGHAGAASGAAAVRAVFRKARDDAAAAVAGGRGGDGVGAGEAGAGLPRLLRD